MPMKVFYFVAIIITLSMLSASTMVAQTIRPRVPESIYQEGYEAVKRLFNQAVIAGDLEICKELLERNAIYVNGADAAGFTQLHYAAMSGQADLCRLLLHFGARADIPRRGEPTVTPLEAAIANDHTEAALVLINAISPESLAPIRGRNQPPLFLAIQNENVEIIKALLAKNADVNAPGRVSEVVQTPFAYAVAIGNTEIAQILLDAGANVRFEQGNIRTADALLTAALSRNYDMCAFLVEAGIDVNTTFDEKRTVLHHLLGQRELFSFYRKMDPFGGVWGQPFTVTGPYKRVAHPYEAGKVETNASFIYRNVRPEPDFRANRLIKLFVDAGADVNVRDENDASVLETLFFAQIEGIRAFEDFRSLLELLIAADVDLNAADENGWTPLYYLLFYCFLDEPEDAWELSETQIRAIADKKIALFNMFIEAGAEVKTADKNGNTLLHYVVQSPLDSISKGRFQIDLIYDSRGIHRLFGRQLIELLLENGLSLTDENNDGETPLDWAQGSRLGMMGGSGMGGMGGMGGFGGGGMGGSAIVPPPMSLPSLSPASSLGF